MSSSTQAGLPNDHPHYRWLMDQILHAEREGEQEVLSLLKHGVELAELCNNAWQEILRLCDGNIMGLELCDPKYERYAAILEDASEPGRYRAQFYDARGFSGHSTRDTAVAVLEELTRDGYRVLAPGAMLRLSQTREWSIGTLVTNLISKVNAGQLTYQAMHEEMAIAEARMSA